MFLFLLIAILIALVANFGEILSKK